MTEPRKYKTEVPIPDVDYRRVRGASCAMVEVLVCITERLEALVDEVAKLRRAVVDLKLLRK